MRDMFDMPPFLCRESKNADTVMQSIKSHSLISNHLTYFCSPLLMLFPPPRPSMSVHACIVCVVYMCII